MGKFVIKQTKTGYTFALKAGNGETIAIGGEVYSSLDSCKNGCESVMKNAPEAALEDQCIRVDQSGSHTVSWDGDELPCPHVDEKLHCLYRMEVQEDHIDFFLRRDKIQLQSLMEEGEKMGIRRFVGLYQQLGASFAQATAADTARFHA